MAFGTAVERIILHDFTLNSVTKRAMRSFVIGFVTITTFLFFLQFQSLTLIVESENQALSTRAESSVAIVRNMVQRDFATLVNDTYFAANVIQHSGYLQSRDSRIKSELEEVFVESLTTHSSYDQLRLLSESGRELIRVNQNNGRPNIVPSHQLQDKSDRYYFLESLHVEPGQVYVSKLDLNYENGKLESPLKPVLRILVPIWSTSNQVEGVVILNYSAQSILKSIQLHLNQVIGNAMVLDETGAWILKDDQDVEWSFLLGENQTLATEAPQLWNNINRAPAGRFDYLDNHYLVESVPLDSNSAHTRHSSDVWKIAVAYQKVRASVSYYLSQPSLYLLPAFGFFLTLVLLWLLCLQEAKRRFAEIELSNLNQNLEAEVARRTKEIETTKNITIESLASLAETRDNETGAHIRRTQRYIEVLLDELMTSSPYQTRITDKAADLIVKSAPLHDLGKVGIPDEILLKPGKLTKDEFERMKTHTTLGFEALDSAIRAQKDVDGDSFLVFAQQIAYSHHEKWDGSGYPLGLKGDEIPLCGRLMAIADVYDALVSKRVYKDAFSREKAENIILYESDGHFDPVIVAAFEKLRDQFWDIRQQHQDPRE